MNAFDQRRQSDPQGLIDDLLAQTSRQGATIHRLTKTVAELERNLAGAGGRGVSRLERSNLKR